MSTISTYIRDQAFQRLTTGVIGANWASSRKVPLPTVQGDQLPCLAVYLLSEQMDPDGDANVGPPRYLSTMHLGISVIDSADKPDVIDGNLDALVDLIENTLLQDITFVSLQDTNGNYLIESFAQIRRSFAFPQQSESYMIEARLDISIQYRCFFEPIAPNKLTDVDVDTQPFDGTVQQPTYTTDIVLPQS